MKLMIAAIAMTSALPTFAQSTVPIGQHGQHAAHIGATGHSGHADQSEGHEDHRTSRDCCEKGTDGKMACCKEAKAQGKKAACCEKSTAEPPAADPHAGHDMSSD